MAAATHALQFATTLRADSTLRLLSGNRMPVLGLGTYQLKHHTADAVTQALAAGYQMLDTAGDYHTQRGIGDALGPAACRAIPSTS